MLAEIVCSYGMREKRTPGGDRRRQSPSGPAAVSTAGHGLVLAPGMTFSLEPSCVLDRHLVHLGGTVLVGEDGPIELAASTARLLDA
ncbi:hypothetical protein [Nonomuraea basaltis]|uniref:hypothetical protein n=1 Tax=Nonomuraea basaltis TaxID=2495887 RepID=UPI00110C4DD7|nr:hypothetical protein [Nonomuraea basaltis]TMR94252.1 hypothetical protein EJK15_34725 [Nonomuraea basaltis]